MLDTQKGTGAVTRVLIDSTDGDQTWTTIGVNENIIEASWQALLDSIHFGLLRAAGVGARSGNFMPVPTDPFVPSELADRPRQQQNLPPGLAPPPARDWRADRPGDLGRRRAPRARCWVGPDRTSATRTRWPARAADALAHVAARARRRRRSR